MRKKIINLKRIPFLLLPAFLLFSFAGMAQKTDKSMSVTGELVDMSCYMKSGAHGDGHKDCASACIKGGSPMGIVTSDGKVYLLVENHDKADAFAEAKKHASEKVTVKGTYSEKGGVQALVVNEVKVKT